MLLNSPFLPGRKVIRRCWLKCHHYENVTSYHTIFLPEYISLHFITISYFIHFSHRQLYLLLANKRYLQSPLDISRYHIFAICIYSCLYYDILLMPVLILLLRLQGILAMPPAVSMITFSQGLRSS